MTNFAIDQGAGMRDITTLSYRGSVIIETNTTGFAMEVIGDINDSMSPAVSYTSNYSNDNIMSSGVNLQKS